MEGEKRRFAPYKRHPLVDKFEDELIASRPANYEQNLRIFEAMWLQARAAGVIPRADPLEGIERKIELIRKYHALRRPAREAGPEAGEP